MNTGGLWATSTGNAESWALPQARWARLSEVGLGIHPADDLPTWCRCHWPGRLAVPEQLLQWRLREKAATCGKWASEAPPGCCPWCNAKFSVAGQDECNDCSSWSHTLGQVLPAPGTPTPYLRHQSIILTLSLLFGSPCFRTSPCSISDYILFPTRILGPQFLSRASCRPTSQKLNHSKAWQTQATSSLHFLIQISIFYNTSIYSTNIIEYLVHTKYILE